MRNTFFHLRRSGERAYPCVRSNHAGTSKACDSQAQEHAHCSSFASLAGRLGGVDSASKLKGNTLSSVVSPVCFQMPAPVGMHIPSTDTESANYVVQDERREGEASAWLQTPQLAHQELCTCAAVTCRPTKHSAAPTVQGIADAECALTMVSSPVLRCQRTHVK